MCFSRHTIADSQRPLSQSHIELLECLDSPCHHGFIIAACPLVTVDHPATLRFKWLQVKHLRLAYDSAHLYSGQTQMHTGTQPKGPPAPGCPCLHVRALGGFQPPLASSDTVQTGQTAGSTPTPRRRGELADSGLGRGVCGTPYDGCTLDAGLAGPLFAFLCCCVTVDRASVRLPPAFLLLALPSPRVWNSTSRPPTNNICQVILGPPGPPGSPGPPGPAAAGRLTCRLNPNSTNLTSITSID